MPPRLPSLSRTRRSTTAAPPAPVRRWALGGLVCGTLLALPLFAPAAWLAQALNQASHGRLQLAEAQGTLWQGSALPLLAGAAGSRDASVLPSRLHWSLSPRWLGLRLMLSQDCCIPGDLLLDWQVGWRQQQVRIHLDGDAPETQAVLGHWPAAWLEGLGAPLNTLRPGGELQFSGRNLVLASTPEGWQLQGQAQVDLLQASSRLSSVDPLGSYRLVLQPEGTRLTLTLQTLDGALRLSGRGEIGPQGLRLRGDAQAAPGAEAPLNNLLNIIGKREGALSRISIG